MSYSRASRPMSPPSSGRHSSRTTASARTHQPEQRSVKQTIQPPIKKLVRWLCKKEATQPTRRSRPLAKEKDQTRGFGSSHKVLWAGGSVATLAALAIAPGRIGSNTAAYATCQKVIKSGAEISRGQLSGLAAISQGTSEAAVHQVISEPYCLLPVGNQKATDTTGNTTGNTTDNTRGKAAQGDGTIIKAVGSDVTPTSNAADEAASEATSRQAYPLAFDPAAWVVVSYEQGSYTGYDFVFKP